MVKDGNFPDGGFSEPENAEALSMAIALAKKIDADIVMASDPDADRVDGASTIRAVGATMVTRLVSFSCTTSSRTVLQWARCSRTTSS